MQNLRSEGLLIKMSLHVKLLVFLNKIKKHLAAYTGTVYAARCFLIFKITRYRGGNSTSAEEALQIPASLP